MEFQKLLRNQETDQRWNETILHSPQSRIYALTPMLDALCPEWEAYADKDFRYLFPLTRFKKGIFKIAVQPFFLQQLGVFSADGSLPDLKYIFDSLLAPMRQVHIFFHAGWLNELSAPETYNISSRVNYILPLNADIDSIRKNFSDNTKRNLKKAVFTSIEEISAADYINFAGLSGLFKSWGVKPEDLKKLLEGLTQSKPYISFEILAVKEDGQILAAGILAFFGKRMVYISGGSSVEGTDKKAMFVLMNHWIEKHAGSDFILDFEGSNLPGVARFFASFGAVREDYLQVHRSRFPFK